MKSAQPHISIGLPVFNGAKFLRPALDSILQQDYTDFELIISDNASTDETSAICQHYAERDSRIRYVRNEVNIGAAGNYRRAFELSRCDYFKWATHDDVHLPGFLRRCVEVLDQAPASVVLVAPRTEVIDENGKRMPDDWQAERLETRRPQPHQRIADVLRKVDWATAQFGLFRAGALRKTRLIDRFHACDYVLLLELAILGEIWEIPEVLFQRRFHAAVSTSANKTPSELLQWFDPSQKPKGRIFPRMKLDLVPRTRLGWEYARSIARMPMSARERLVCFPVAFYFWASRESRRLGHQYWIRLRRKLVKASMMLRWHRVEGCHPVVESERVSKKRM